MKHIRLWVLVLVGLALGSALPAFAQDTAPEIVWTFPTEGAIWSSPVVADGTVYFGSNDGYLYAVDALTGAEIWRFAGEDEMRSRPAVTGTLVITSCDDGYLYAVDRHTGTEVWRADISVEMIARMREFGSPRGIYDYLQSSPTVADEVIYVGSLDGDVYAFDLATSALIWQVNAYLESFASVRSSPTVADGIVYVGQDAGTMLALDATTGALIWQAELGGAVKPSPTVANGIVYIGSRGAVLYALDAATGAEVWQFSYGTSWVESSARVVDDVVYIGSSDAQRLYALDAATGALIWEFDTAGWAWSSPAYANGVVYIGKVGYAQDHFFAVDAATGAAIWSLKLDNSLDDHHWRGVGSSPTATEGIVYFGGLDGVLYAVRAAR